jgi:hypothetical protein
MMMRTTTTTEDLVWVFFGISLDKSLFFVLYSYALKEEKGVRGSPKSY